jgi:hypothetical protein
MAAVLPRKLLAAGALLCFTAVASAQSRPAVVELFTSEGCSSCPPAEGYIGELAQRGDVLALSFHVDYWDDLGWRDRFGLSEAVQRQRVYAVTLRSPSVYTPQVVVDGQGDYLGSDRGAIGRALSRNRSGVPVGLSVRDGEVQVEVGAQAPAVSGDVLLVAYLRKAVSAIGRGENAGRTLQEFNIVRAIRTLGRWEGGAKSFHAQISSLPADSTDVAVLVQRSGQGLILGTATRALR